MNDDVVPDETAVVAEVDRRNRQRKKIIVRDVATFYGQRPTHQFVWCLSPYEFVSEWEIIILSNPQEVRDVDHPLHDVTMTDAGIQQLKAQDENGTEAELEPGIDYVVKSDGGQWWLSFPDLPSTQHFRHEWIMKRRLRDYAPTVLGSPFPQRRTGDANRSALITLTYFHPWTLSAQDSTPHVPYIGHLRPADMSWGESMSHWLDGNI